MRFATLLTAVLAVVAVVAVNVLLLGFRVAGRDPVGQLSPIVAGIAPTTALPRPHHAAEPAPRSEPDD
jgi:hypothetical protein